MIGASGMISELYQMFVRPANIYIRVWVFHIPKKVCIYIYCCLDEKSMYAVA